MGADGSPLPQSGAVGVSGLLWTLLAIVEGPITALLVVAALTPSTPSWTRRVAALLSVVGVDRKSVV